MAPLTPEQEKAKALQGLQDQLRSLGYVGGRAIEALDLIQKSTFPAADAVKVVQATRWLEDVAKDISRQAKEVEDQIAKLQPATTTPQQPPKIEVIEPKAPAQPAPEAVSAAQDQAAGEIPEKAPLSVDEAAETLKS